MRAGHDNEDVKGCIPGNGASGLRNSRGKRLMLRVLLATDRPLTCAAISEQSGVSLSGVAHAMRSMAVYGWVQVGREGRSRTFTLLPHIRPYASTLVQDDASPSL